MNTIASPGDAMGLVSGELRRRGYSMIEAEAGEAARSVGDAKFSVSGQVGLIDDDYAAMGEFRATVLANGRFVIKSGLFGLIADDHDDPFFDL